MAEDELLNQEEIGESEAVGEGNLTPRAAGEPIPRELMDVTEQKADDFMKSESELSLDDKIIFYKERECLLLLLEARKLLSSLIMKKEEQDKRVWAARRALEEEEKKRSGKLSVQEIQDILQNQADDDDGDMVTEITELKKNLVIAVRLNHKLDRDVAKLDKRIALLIKNQTTLQDVVMASKGKKKKIVQAGEAIDAKKMEHYQELFYLLQTEPVYLARCIYVVSPQQLESFLDTVILTLFGDAFSPREEFLVLSLFQLAIQREISVVKTLADFISGQSETVLPKMINNYNRRKQGIEYLRKVLSPILEKVIGMDLKLDVKPQEVYMGIINEEEMSTGEKSKLNRDATVDEISANPQVQSIVRERINKLQEVCQMFVDGIINNLDELPYGLRWLCKQLNSVAKESLPDTTDDDVTKVIVYFVYYRFINLAVVTPDTDKIVTGDLPGMARKALVVISKVLQHLFNFKRFGQEAPHMAPMNAFLERNEARVREYVADIPDVADPEDALRVNKYMELAQKAKPVIMISLDEIFRTHSLIHENIESLAPENDDPLRVIMNDLGEPPTEFSEEDKDRELQLTLTNRFKVDVEDDDDTQRLYAETKELVIPILRLVPIQNTIHRLNLMDVLEAGIKYATETNNKQLSGQINKILENMGRLEREGMVAKDDNYESFVHDVALEVANRRAIRDQQRKEIARLKSTLGGLKGHQVFLDEQIADYNSYLKACKEQQMMVARKKGKKSKKSKNQDGVLGPFKYTYKELEKKGVIVDSEVPSLSRKKTSFAITSSEPGIFEIVAKIAGVNIEKMELDFDDLLEKHYNNIHQLALDQVTLDVNMTIHLINKLMVK